MKDISVITTTYNSSNTIRIFDSEIRNHLQKLNLSYEIIYIDDGSTDGTPDILKEICGKSHDTKAFIFSRNFGHHKALWAGITKSTGKWSYLTDSDLEESPANLEIFWREKQLHSEVDVFMGHQVSRRGASWERITGSIVWRFISSSSELHIPINLVTSRLFTSKVRDVISNFSEKEIFIAHTFAFAGFRQQLVPIEKLSLKKSHYSLGRKFKLALDGITNTSIKPLKYIFMFGLFFEILTVLCIFLLTFLKVRGTTTVEGWSTLVALNLFTSGIILLSIGTVGLYISRIFLEVKGKPSFIIRDEY
ncbi:WcaA Glycosyltransferases involved in cell wall biogenesis [Candidatus Nanopelagicaceae bacterium]